MVDLSIWPKNTAAIVSLRSLLNVTQHSCSRLNVTLLTCLQYTKERLLRFLILKIRRLLLLGKVPCITVAIV